MASYIRYFSLTHRVHEPFSILMRLTVPRHPSIRAHQGKLGFGKVYFPYASLSDCDVNSVQSGVCGSQVMLMKVTRRNDAPGHQHRSGVTSRPPVPVPSLLGKKTNKNSHSFILEALGFIARKQLKVDSGGECALAWFCGQCPASPAAALPGECWGRA